MKKIWLAVLLFSLSACGHEPVGRDFAFDESKDYALLAYDIYFIGETWPNFTLYLFPYDPADGTIDYKKRVEMGCGFLCDKGNEEVRFYLKPINPGTYVIGYMNYQHSYKNTLLCFPEKTLKVEPRAGTIHYLGEIVIPMDYGEGLFMTEFEVLEHDKGHLRKRLQKFPNILEVDPLYYPDGTPRAERSNAEPGALAAPDAEYVSFVRPEVKKETACIWDYEN